MSVTKALEHSAMRVGRRLILEVRFAQGKVLKNAC